MKFFITFPAFTTLVFATSANAAKWIKGDEFGGGAAPFDSSEDTCVPIDEEASTCKWQRQGSLRSGLKGVRMSCELKGLAPNHAYTVWTHFASSGPEFATVGDPGNGAYGCSDENGNGDFASDGWVSLTLAGTPWTSDQWSNTNADAILIDHGPCDDEIEQFASPVAGCDPTFLMEFQCQEDDENGNGVPYCYAVGRMIFEG